MTVFGRTDRLVRTSVIMYICMRATSYAGMVDMLIDGEFKKKRSSYGSMMMSRIDFKFELWYLRST